MMKFFLNLLLFFLVGNLLNFGIAQANNHTYGFHVDEKAFDGNDLISYFDGELKKGKDEITYTFNDVKLYFASDVNRERFKKDPEKYFPAYNGWCAIALTKGMLKRPNYNNFKVQDGKLLFFRVRAFFNGRTAWEKNPDLNKILADKKYTEIKNQSDKFTP